ncbi:MAG: hypothetical protein AAF311_06370 [Pseudomonadota bacterium]
MNMDGSVRLVVTGRGEALVLLPPAPHDGSFYDPLLPHLGAMMAVQVDYPGYGGSAAIPSPSIPAYADALAPHLPRRPWLVGFHTGNLVAAELSRRIDVAGIVMIDVPFFDPATRRDYAAKFDDSPRNAAFHAAFAYDPDQLTGLPCSVRLIATASTLQEPTRRAAAAMGAPLTQRIDVTAPVFEAHGDDMAAEIENAVRDMGNG